MADAVKGLLVFYLDVGMLPPFKAEAFCHRVMDHVLSKCKTTSGREWEFPDDVGLFVCPVRSRKTEMVYINFSDATPGVEKKIKKLEKEFKSFFKELKEEKDEAKSDI